VAEGLAEDRLMPLLARCAADAVAADWAAVFVQPDVPGGSGRSAWRLGGSCGADPEVLAGLPTAYGEGGGVLAPVFQGAREVSERDLLDGAADDAAVPPRLPARALVGLPLHRRDSRLIGVLLVGAKAKTVFGDAALDALRAIGQLVGVGVTMPAWPPASSANAAWQPSQRSRWAPCSSRSVPPVCASLS
jgi:GAF domain-containing protein